DDEHLQEYTQMEFYWAYADYNDLIDYCEELTKYVIGETFGTMELEHDGKTVDWSKKWDRIQYYDFVEKYAGIKLAEYDTLEKLQNLATSLGLEYEESAGKGRLIDLIYKKTARPKCIEPVWLIDLPTEVSPLAKRKADNPELTERMQLIAYGSELSNGFSELNDPVDQLERFQEQQRLREAGDGEAMMLDRDYVQALEIGMPPTAGFAYSERLFSVLLGKPIRETTPFPLMRSEENKVGKEKETQVAHSILLKNEDIQLWEQINAASHLSAAFAARVGQSLFFSNSSRSQDGEQILMNIQNAIVIKQTDSSAKILELKRKAEELGLSVATFTKDMLDSSDDSKVMEAHAIKNIEDIEFRGVLVFGKIKAVKELTKEFELWSSSGAPTKNEISEFYSGSTRLLSLEDNTYLYNCEANVLEVGNLEGSDYIILDQTVFYPQGGGQPSDVGVIKSDSNEYNVTKCQKIDGKVYHFVDSLEGVGVNDKVEVSINAELRKLHARIHTAGHIIDEAVKNLNLDIEADKGYHFPQGPYVQYIGELENPSDYINDLNTEINKIVNKDSKISYQLFQKSVEPERLMTVEGYKPCHCGGTHVQNLNEIGKVNIRKIKSKKGLVKVSYEVLDN
ncbi:MAG: DUF2000 family protein, partial [Thermales bacterium]|nr:DUF2000 family protein [Thermales bacterium]